MTEETDDEFLARIRPPFLTRADRARIALMMAAEAERLGDHAGAARLRAENRGSDAEGESSL